MKPRLFRRRASQMPNARTTTTAPSATSRFSESPPARRSAMPAAYQLAHHLARRLEPARRRGHDRLLRPLRCALPREERPADPAGLPPHARRGRHRLPAGGGCEGSADPRDSPSPRSRVPATERAAHDVVGSRCQGLGICRAGVCHRGLVAAPAFLGSDPAVLLFRRFHGVLRVER